MDFFLRCVASLAVVFVALYIIIKVSQSQSKIRAEEEALRQEELERERQEYEEYANYILEHGTPLQKVELIEEIRAQKMKENSPNPLAAIITYKAFFD